MIKKWLKINLQLFADSGSESAQGAENISSDTAVNTSSFAKKKANKNPMSEIQYGKKEEVATSTPDDTRDNKSTDVDNADSTVKSTDDNLIDDFESLIKGKYKDDFQKKVQNIVESRLKTANKAKAEMEALKPTLDLLSDMYGVDVNDANALYEAISGDSTRFFEEASARGLSVEQYRYQKQMEAENNYFRELREEQERQRQFNEVIDGWRQEASNLANKYPNLNFDEEMANPKMIDMLTKGIGFETAYQAAHFDELTTGALMYATNKVAKNITDGIKAKGARPIENGMSSGASIIYKTDVSKLSREDRAEIARRVKAGDKSIRF